MDGDICPLCLKPLPPTQNSVTVSCRDCNKTWTPRQLAIGAGSRARLIAEAVKPLRDALRDIVDDAIKMTAGDGDYYYACGLVYVDAASALLNSESVKTPIEAQLEEEIKPRRFWFCPKCRGFMEAPDGTGLTVCAKGHDMTRCVPAYLTRADFESVKTNEETT